MIEVLAVPQEASLEAFLQARNQVYRELPLSGWIPPLDRLEREALDPSGRNPVFGKCTVQYFVARKAGRWVGRISVYLAHHPVVGIPTEEVAFFGHFEAVPDGRVARALVEAAQSWARARGRVELMGPASFAYDGMYGVLIQGQEYLPMVLTPWNPAYYQTLLEGLGAEKAMDFHAWLIPLDPPSPRVQHIEALEARYRARGIRLRQARLQDLAGEMHRVMEVYNRAWADNWGTVPLDKDDMAFLAEELRPLLIPEAAWIAEKDGEPVGVALGLPNLLEAVRDWDGRFSYLRVPQLLWRLGKLPGMKRGRIRTGRLLILGVTPPYRDGLGVVLAARTFLAGRRYGLRFGEGSLTLEVNYPVENMIRRMGGFAYKTFRVYRIPV